ncbi:MAG: phosphotransferase [Lentisphaerae bacterium]|nr:phosphotransferase [Lentisphaerota bacterium]
MPRKAVILAAGFGTRLLPISLETPKPLMPLWGKPVIGRVMDMLARWGVREFLVNAHYQPDPLFAYVRERCAEGLKISVSFEPEILGTGGALRKAAWFLDKDPFWMVNADIAVDLAPYALTRLYRSRRPLAVLWLHPTLGPRTVEMRGGVITNFQSARPESDGTYTFCGLHLLSPDILEYLPREGFSPVIRGYEKAMAMGRVVMGVCEENSFWEDIGTPESYLRAHGQIARRHKAGLPGAALFDPASARKAGRLLKAGVVIRGFVSLGRNVRAEPGATLENAVVWDGARIAAGATVTGAVVARNTEVRGTVKRMALRSDTLLDGAAPVQDRHLAQVLAKLRWAPNRTLVLPLEPRGSARTFTRLRHARRTVILIRYSLDRAENALYAQHARFLKGLGLRVPDVIIDDPAQRLLVIEDLGNRSLQDSLKGLPLDKQCALYSRVLSEIAVLHGAGAAAARKARLEMVHPFSADLYQWEREFFARHFLVRRLGLSDADVRSSMADLEQVARRLLAAPAVLVHRDLQSSNVLFAGARPAFIDFQGMRMGAAAYDLASLLCDPYVGLPLSMQVRLATAYANASGAGETPGELVWWAAVERLAQAIGAFGRLGASPETAGFARHIPPALAMMRRALSFCGRLKALESAMRRAEDIIPDPQSAP